MDSTLRNQLLDAALELFSRRGYTETSVNAIIAHVGVSKGAFYHYFESKDQLLATLCKRLTDKQLAIIMTITNETNLSAPQKLVNIALALEAMAINEEARHINNLLQENPTVTTVHAVIRDATKRATELYQQVIEQGMSEGVFATQYPGELARLYVQLVNIFKRELTTLRSDPSGLQRTLMFYEESLCRLLGAAPGTIDLASHILNRKR